MIQMFVHLSPPTPTRITRGIRLIGRIGLQADAATAQSRETDARSGIQAGGAHRSPPLPRDIVGGALTEPTPLRRVFGNVESFL
jgi:hypothetical protein